MLGISGCDSSRRWVPRFRLISASLVEPRKHASPLPLDLIGRVCTRLPAPGGQGSRFIGTAQGTRPGRRRTETISPRIRFNVHSAGQLGVAVYSVSPLTGLGVVGGTRILYPRFTPWAVMSRGKELQSASHLDARRPSQAAAKTHLQTRWPGKATAPITGLEGRNMSAQGADPQ